MIMVPIKEALTFDDVTLAPKYSEVLPSEVDTSIKLTKFLKLKIPLLSSAMDTVTESKMAIAIAKAGGLGIIHRNLDIKKQVSEVKKVKKLSLLVGAAVGAGPREVKRAEALLKENLDMIVVDTAHGHSKKVFEIISFIKKKKNKKTALCAGNIATPEAAKFLLKAGVDVIKVGIGPGSICTTRLVAGIGVPQLSAILNVRGGIKNKNVKIISDGGIKYSGDLAKAFAAGADAVMIGSLFAGTDETPGKLIKKNGKLYKSFRGMGSVGAMNKGSADRYFQSKQKDQSKYVPEGVEGLAKYKGKVDKIIFKLVGGLRSSMGYLGSKQIKYLRSKPIVGVVYDIPNNEKFFALKDGGSFCNDSKISVSNKDRFSEGLYVTGFIPYDENYIDKNLQVIKNINLNSHGVRRLGAASLDMCHVAKGIVEGFWEYNLQPWDTAAGNIIVTEAGGNVSNENGNQYNFDKCIVVSNNKVHKDFLKIINES